MNQVIPLTDKLEKISEEFNISYDEIINDKIVNIIKSNKEDEWIDIVNCR